MKPKLRYRYFRDDDIFLIEGTRYSGEFFRTLGSDGPDIGATLRIDERKDGVVTLTMIARAREGDEASGQERE